MAGIPGLGSGINVKDMVSALVSAERAPKTNQLDRLEKQTTTRITALGSLTSAMNTFKTAIDGLNKSSLFEARTATTSNTSVIKVTASTTAPAGSYNLQVQQLATSSKVGLQSVSGGNTATFGSGSLAISAGNKSFTVDVTDSNNTLAGIRDAINQSGKDSGISATIITDDSGSRLVLSSSNTGDGSDIKVVGTGDDVTSGTNSLDVLSFEPQVNPSDTNSFLPPNSADGAGGVISKAKSAKLTIDGLQLVRPTNKITDALEGVTLDLAAAQSTADLAEGKTISVTVGVDKAGVKGNLQKFVDAYNALTKTISELSVVAPVEGSDRPVTGPLQGDASTRNIMTKLRNELVQVVGEGGVRALVDLGVTSNEKDGTLSIDDTALTNALTNNFDQVSNYLTKDNGLMGRLGKAVDSFVGTDGTLKQRDSALRTTLKDVDKQRKALDERIASLETRLYSRYNAMDSLVGQLSRTSESLGSMLANLPGFVKKST